MKMLSLKKMTKSVVLGVIVLTMSTVVFAAGDLKFSPVTEGKAKITLTNSSVATTTLSIESADGFTSFYSQKIQDNTNFAKLFDFSKLQDGEYVLVAEMDDEKLVKSFTIKNSAIVTKDVFEANQTIAPFFKMHDAKLICLYANPSNKAVSVEFTKANEVFFNDNVTGTMARSYNLEALPSGEYTVTVSVDSKEYTYHLKK